MFEMNMRYEGIRYCKIYKIIIKFAQTIIIMGKKFMLSDKGTVQEGSPSGISNSGQIFSIVILSSNGDVLQCSPAQLQAKLGSSETIVNLTVTGTAEFDTTSDFKGVATFEVPVIYSAATGITAAGTNQATATPLTKGFNNITTCSVNTKGCALPTAVAGQLCVVKNTSANDVLLYPASGDAIDLVAVDTAITLYVGQEMWFWPIDGTTWQSGAHVSLFGVQIIAGAKTFSSKITVPNIAGSGAFQSRAAAASGDVYIDTAANILGFGDLILAQKPPPA